MSTTLDLDPDVLLRPGHRLMPPSPPVVLAHLSCDLGPGFGRDDRVLLMGEHQGLAVLQSAAGHVAHVHPDLVTAVHL